MLFVFLMASAFFLYGACEHRLHLRSLRAIPTRVHVNGTRGKSSVTRLIAAGLRAGGLRTAAKTTGSAARYIHPDGSEEPILRIGGANIREQMRVARRAAGEGVGVLVVECMAIRPRLQAISERMLVRSTIGVITNVRPDHLDEMGPTIDDVAEALAGTVPRGGILFTSEHERSGPVAARADTLGTEFREVAVSADARRLTEGFSHVEHAENVALALAVCAHLGVPRDVALSGMRAAAPDPGALTIDRVCFGDRQIEFVNAFAANDRESTIAIWEALGALRAEAPQVFVVVGTRADRADRAHEFGAILAGDLEADRYLLTGSLTHPVRTTAIRLGLPDERLLDLAGRGADEILRRIVELTTERSIVIGVGNIGGVGGRLAALFQERSESE